MQYASVKAVVQKVPGGSPLGINNTIMRCNRLISILDMIPGRMPAGVNCKIVPPFQKNRLLIVLNPFKEKVGPLPAPTSVSIQPLWENNLLQPKFIPPTPENNK